MTRLAAKILTVCAIAAALALVGCGGDDDSATVTGPDGNTTEIRTDNLSPQQQKKFEQLRDRAEQRRKQSERAAKKAEVPFREPTGSAPTSSGSMPNEGERTATPGVPLAKGGDNSIQTFGVEAPADERVQAARVAQAYFNARLDGEWALACSYLSAPIKQQLVAFGGQARGQAPPDCSQVMRAFTQGVSKTALRVAADIDVLSLRAEDEQAFLIYKDGRGTPSQIPMNLDGGAWKVAAIAGSALVL